MMLTREELRKAIEDGTLSIGCPLPEGFTSMTDEDKERLRDVMIRVIEMERGNAKVD